MREERGVALLEVIVSAVVLLIATGATLAILDGSSRASADNRYRVQASTLAEQEMERLRGLSLRTLDGYDDPARTVLVDGIKYEVTSSTKWVNDTAGFTPTCTSGTDGTSDYLQLTVTVDTTNDLQDVGMRPQTLRSLLSPRVSTVGYKGTLSVPFKDRSGNPLQGVPTTLTGPETGTATSNVAGCAVFNYFKAGTYTATYSRSGYVVPSGDATGSVSGVINTGQTNFTSAQRFDRAATVNVFGETRRLNAPENSVTTVRSVSLANADLGTSSGARTFPAANASGSNSIAATSLFPFADGYAAYAGTCSANDPTKYGDAGATVSVTPGGTSSATVFVPTVFVTAPAGFALRKYVFTATDSGCSATFSDGSTTSNSLETTVPYGTYTLCIQVVSQNQNRFKTRTVNVRRGPAIESFDNTNYGYGTC